MSTDKIDGEDELVAESAVLHGQRFLQEFPRLLTRTLGVKFALIGELSGLDKPRINVVSFWPPETFADGHEYELSGTPCEKIIGKVTVSLAEGVQDAFPRDKKLRELGIEGYVGAPLVSSTAEVAGLIAAFHGSPITDVASVERILGRYATRIGGS